MNEKVIIIGVAINAEKTYSIEDVSLLTGYTTGYIRNLERAKKIPLAQRDVKGWRVWRGADVERIVDYCKDHYLLGSRNLIGNKANKKK